MSEVLQSVAVGVIVAAAFAYLVHHLTGWPPRRTKPPGQTAILGDRMKKALEKAQKLPPDDA